MYQYSFSIACVAVVERLSAGLLLLLPITLLAASGAAAVTHSASTHHPVDQDEITAQCARGYYLSL